MEGIMRFTGPAILQVLSVILALSLPLSARGHIVAKKYPYLIVTPTAPQGDTDQVGVRIMLGEASNSCVAPVCTADSFVVLEGNLAVFPPQFIIQVAFTETPLPPGLACPAVYNPVDYGPSFHLGILRPGVYTVTGFRTATEEAVYGQFTVADSTGRSGLTVKGTVKDDPFPAEIMPQPVSDAALIIRSFPRVVNAREIAPEIFCDTVTTDVYGNYLFRGVPADTYVLTCIHTGFRTVERYVTVSADATQDFFLVSTGAFAAVAGTVSMFDPENADPAPVEGCSITVYRNRYAAVGGPIFSEDLKFYAVTDENGRFLVESIPITANGEPWTVRAVFGSYNDAQNVGLRNMFTDSANFILSGSYQNRDSVKFDGAFFTISTNKAVYRRNEPVIIQYSITNTMRSSRTYGPFSAGCEYDLIITPLWTAVEAEIYRESNHPVCTGVERFITVEPLQTVMKEFRYTMPDLTSLGTSEPPDALVAPGTILLRVAARLRGEEYANTLASVVISVDNDPVGVSASAREISGAGSKVSHNARSGVVTLGIAETQDVHFRLYTLSGASVPGGSLSRRIPAGIHSVALPYANLGKGTYVVSVKGKNFEKRFRAFHTGGSAAR